MSTTAGHDRAFPSKANDSWYDGLTKQEYFAAMAMQGILANCCDSTDADPSGIAHDAVLYADKLIAALSAKRGEESQ